MQQNELQHYGILGMKWGKRKATYDSKSNSNKSSSNNSRFKLTKDEKNALKVAGAMTGISAVQTIKNYKNAQSALDAMGYGDKIYMNQVIAKGTVAAGRAAVIGILAYAGSKKVSEYVKNRNNSED